MMLALNFGQLIRTVLHCLSGHVFLCLLPGMELKDREQSSPELCLMQPGAARVHRLLLVTLAAVDADAANACLC